MANATRTCAKCKQSKPIAEFLPSSSPFQPSGYTIYCMDCLERMVDATNLA